MTKSNYSLRYLPLFYDDLMQAVNYISQILKNPEAALRLVSDVENAVLTRLPAAESFEKYCSQKERNYPYYCIRVRNYSIYYVVMDEGDTKIMEVRRLFYNGRDINKLL